MRVLMVGGGSGGHVTPVLAIIKELKKHHPRVEIRFWCDRGFASQAKKILTTENDVVIKAVFAGKLRRYHTQTLGQRLRDVPTLLRNIGDLFLIALGFLQSFIRLLFWRPQVVFCKGGFVCLPVGLAAALLHVPLVIHDSDAHPGLTNRILSRFAKVIATGAPIEKYSYPSEKTRYVGIPVNTKLHPITATTQQELKQSLGLPKGVPLLLVTGGGLGARNINQAVLHIADDLLTYTSVVHVCGVKQYEECSQKAPQHEYYKLLPFVDSDTMAQLINAADLVVARAGATTMLELAAAGKATVVVPNALLTGGHQLKNARMYEKAKAIEIVDERDMVADPALLQQTVVNLLESRTKRRQLASALHAFAKPEAATQLAQIIEQTASRKGE